MSTPAVPADQAGLNQSPGKRGGHNLPQMPSMTPTRMAVSKANRKSDPSPTSNQFINIVSMEDIEGKKPETTPSEPPPSTPSNVSQEEDPLPSSLHTPPSEKSTSVSPVSKIATNNNEKPAPPPAPSPIRLRIHRSPDNGGKLMSTVTELPPPSAKPVRARTKEDIKKQLLKKKEKGRRCSEGMTPGAPEAMDSASVCVCLYTMFSCSHDILIIESVVNITKFD